MNQQLDSLFKSKLGHHAMPPAPEAWSRIESRLTKPANQMLWLKVAAGVALLVTASIILINPLTSDKQSIARQTIESADKKLSETNTPSLLPETPSSEIPPVTTAKRMKLVSKPRKQEIQQVVATDHPVEVTESAAVAQVDEEIIAQPATGLFIMLSAEEVNSKYLLKTTETEATVDYKKSSRLQKLAGLAHNLSNEDILGDLRNRKNELFALNFLDDKKEKKN